MLAVVASATLHGLEGRVIRVEADVAPGLPGFSIVGLPDTAVTEARERVRGAIRNAGYLFPARRITINLAPADLRKAGASLDLAIAMAILLGSDQASAGPDSPAFLGELSLGGEVAPVPGILPMVAALARAGTGRVVLAEATVDEARLVDGMTVVGVASLAAATRAVQGRRSRRAAPVARPRVSLAPVAPASAAPSTARHPDVPDLAEVRGQAPARRALEIALAGGHGLLLSGPPGIGKTLLARTIPGLLPPLGDAAALAVTVVASAAGEGPIRTLRREPPFRAPHHTLSYAAMVGGGPALTPGEITRADHGVLFLDELAEFDRDVLEALRQPLEDERVVIARAGRVTTFPARFQLVAAMNPCPCGLAGATPDGRCACTDDVIARYQRRVSGPLRDRIDLVVPMARVPAATLVALAEPETSAMVAARIAAVRHRSVARNGGRLNGRLRGRELRRRCPLDASGRRRLVELGEAESASGRGTERLLRVARTIADLAGSPDVGGQHLDEASWFGAGAGPRLDALAS